MNPPGEFKSHNEDVLRIAVISDLHAFQDKDEKSSDPSYLKVDSRRDAQNPVKQLIDMAVREGLSADLLLSPGDLGDKAEPIGIQHAWECLHDIGKALKCGITTAATGNHDLDSRKKYCPFDPSIVLRTLEPSFPLADQEEIWRYWADRFAIVSNETFRLVILNSSGYHGYSPEENRHGRVSPFTIDQITQKLNNTPAAKFNIFLCHHHPHSFKEIYEYDEDYEQMLNGQKILDKLGMGLFGDWIVIHGHKHHAKLVYASGGSGAPVVFAAGSFSAAIDKKLSTLVRNQFHIVEMSLGALKELRGTVTSWDWSPAGWTPAQPERSGMPHVAPFGCRKTPNELARQIAQLSFDEVRSWKEVQETIPDLKWIRPDDQLALIQILERNFQLIARPMENPIEIGKGR